MRIFLPPPPPKTIAKLEVAAARRPRLYSLQLVALTFLGDVVLTFVRVFPLAAPIVIGTLFYNHPFVNWFAVIAVLLLIWLVRAGYRDNGMPLSRKAFAGLLGAIDALKKDLDVGRRLEVRLSDDSGASARETRGILGLIGTKRVLTLGIPLLAVLGKDETRAVIAHELGHFSRRHGRFGHWLYSAHMGWLWHAESIDNESTVIDRAGAGFALMFIPPFSRRAMVWSRRCEYEADADAARVVGGRHLVSALVRLGMFEDWAHRELPRMIRGWQSVEPAAPADYLERMMTAFEKATPVLIPAAQAREVTLAADWRDTHPPARERAAALDLTVEVQPWTEAGGPALLGTTWDEVAASFNGRWRKENALAWAVAHERARLIDAPLMEIDASIAAGWPLEQRLARARALRGIDPAAGLAELKVLKALASDNDAITFALAAALLADDEAAGIAMMAGLATAKPAYRVPACSRLVRYCARSGGRAEVERWEDQLEVSGTQLMRTSAIASEAIASGKVNASTRPTTVMACLRAGMAQEPRVAKAWLLEGNAVLGTTKNPRAAVIRVDALLLIIDPKGPEGEFLDPEPVKLRLRDELSDLIEPNALAVVTSFYSTEPMPENLQTALGRLSPEVAYVRNIA